MTRSTWIVLLLGSVLITPALDAEPPAKPTYSKDIAPIFRSRCESCHRPGEVAPMSLVTYDGVRPWLRSIRNEVRSRSMPPWHADPKHGSFVNDPSLSEQELATILEWIEAGAPEGDPSDLPPPGEWVEGWRIGEPDAVFEIPEPFLVPATGVVPYKYFLVPTNYKEDRWIVRADARPGNREVVHHIIVFVLDKNELGQRKRRGNILEKELAGYAPGEGPAIFRPGTAKLLPRGSTLMFQVHYTPNGKAQYDRSKVGFVFAREPIREEVFTRAIINHRFRIPPHDENHRVEAWSRTFKRDTPLHSLMPHMHLRGKSFEFRLIEPDGSERTLLSVPEYDFDWQHYYAFKEPLVVKKGSKIHCIAHFDNSKNNAANPDPDATVRWGDQTWEEMMIGFLTLSRPVEPAAEKSGEPTATASSDKRERF